MSYCSHGSGNKGCVACAVERRADRICNALTEVLSRLPAPDEEKVADSTKEQGRCGWSTICKSYCNADEAPKTTNLSFSEALEAMKAGKAVRRADWPIVQFIVSLGDRFRMQRPTAGIMSLTSAVEGLDIKGLMAEDVLANDWQIVGDNA